MMKKTVIANRLFSGAAEYLRNNGFEILSFPDNPNVDTRVAYHADLSFFFDGIDTLFIASEFASFADKLKNYCKNVVVINKNLSEKYPGDVLLNCVCVGMNFICNTLTVADEILSKMKESGYNIINVSQGYTKCSVVPVSENALITDDESVYSECVKHGIDVLKVSKGSVSLNGFDYGFIGGTAGLISENTILFNGNIKQHQDYKSVGLFLEKYSVKVVCTEDRLADIGSIIPIGG